MTDTFRVEVDIAEDAASTVPARLFALGALGVWERGDAIVAWFARRPPTLGADLDALAGWHVETDRDWQEEWKATIEPVQAGDIVVVPSWLADTTPVPRRGTRIVLDPGRAFGTGHHATTTLCLEFLQSLPLGGSTVADVGCGSGILAIAAAQRGAQVTAVDIDADAVAVTAANAHANDVEVVARHGDIRILDTVDIVVANLVTDVIAELAAEFARVTRRDLIVSGITAGRRNVALDALADEGFAAVDVRERDGWVAARCAPGRPASSREATMPEEDA